MPERLRIVTLDSFSTEGIGASAPAMAYPAQFQQILDRRFPDAGVEVINRGVAQEVVAGNLARLDRDVLSVSPDLVIWQASTDDPIYLRDFRSIMDQVRFGIAPIGRAGARVALLSPQSFPDETRDRPIRAMNDALRAVAVEAGIPSLDRHLLMSSWASSHTLYPDELLGEDALHMTDRSYECLAIRLAYLISALSRKGGSPPCPDEQPMLQDRSLIGAPLRAGS